MVGMEKAFECMGNTIATAIVAGSLIGIALSNQYRERQSMLESLFKASIEKRGK